MYVPESQIGLVALRQEGRVYVDAYLERAFPAHHDWRTWNWNWTRAWQVVETNRETLRRGAASRASRERGAGHR